MSLYKIKLIVSGVLLAIAAIIFFVYLIYLFAYDVICSIVDSIKKNRN